MTIQNKLFTVLISFAFVLSVSLVAVMQWSLGRGMIEYVNQQELQALKPVIASLENSYRVNQSWHAYEGRAREFDQLLRRSLADTEFFIPPNRHRPPREPRRGDFSPRRDTRLEQNRLADHRPERRPLSANERPENRARAPQVSYALLDKNKSLIVGHYPADREFVYAPIFDDKSIVGYFALSKRHQLAQGYQLDFVEQQQQYLWLITLALVCLALLITLPLARHLVSPIKRLTKGMHQLTQGNYQQRLINTRKDEFSSLARDFNELAQTLEKNEGARKRWLANVSHELRTPVSVLKGELEAMLDGIRPMDKEQIKSANQEVTHLQKLIDDLHMLTSADIGGMSYRKTVLDLAELLNDERNKFDTYLSRHSLTLTWQVPEQEVLLYADETRLCQLLENLFSNCVKYAGEKAQVKVSLSLLSANWCQLMIEDSGVGVDELHLPQLFEHLYRVDDSRNKKTGGTGLGLSICQHIVAAHEGKIVAKPSSLGGLAIVISLPVFIE